MSGGTVDAGGAAARARRFGIRPTAFHKLASVSDRGAADLDLRNAHTLGEALESRTEMGIRLRHRQKRLQKRLDLKNLLVCKRVSHVKPCPRPSQVAYKSWSRYTHIDVPQPGDVSEKLGFDT